MTSLWFWTLPPMPVDTPFLEKRALSSDHCFN
jgi:hypothetical protein